MIQYSNNKATVKISLSQEHEKIIFTVEDNGVGIEDVDKIFSRYYRENSAKGGFGIGLNIVKQIIDEDGISLDVSSELRKGTTFTYVFYINE